jgi:hypothetical protein
LSLHVLAENRIGDMQLFEVRVRGKEAAVKLVESLAAKRLALVHGMKQAQEVLPDGRGFGVVIGVVAALDKEIAEKLRRKR